MGWPAFNIPHSPTGLILQVWGSYPTHGPIPRGRPWDQRLNQWTAGSPWFTKRRLVSGDTTRWDNSGISGTMLHNTNSELLHPRIRCTNPESLPAKVEACKYNAAIAFLHYTAVRCEPISGQISKHQHLGLNQNCDCTNTSGPQTKRLNSPKKTGVACNQPKKKNIVFTNKNGAPWNKTVAKREFTWGSWNEGHVMMVCLDVVLRYQWSSVVL